MSENSEVKQATNEQEVSELTVATNEQESFMKSNLKDKYNKDFDSSEVYYIRSGVNVAIHFINNNEPVFLLVQLKGSSYVLNELDASKDGWVLYIKLLEKLFTDKYSKGSEFSNSFLQSYKPGTFCHIFF